MKLTPLLKIIPIGFILIAIATMTMLSFSVSEERDIFIEQEKLSNLGDKLLETSDFLTEQARYYVQYGEEEYLKAYRNEVETVRTREKVLEQLEASNIPANEVEIAAKANELSHQLEQLEAQAFDAVKKNDIESARQLLFGEQYKEGKQPIIDTLEVFQNVLEKRCNYEIESAKTKADIAILFLIGSMIAILFITFLFTQTINRRIKGILVMSEMAKKLSDGDFNLDLSPYNSKDEFGILAKNLGNIVATVERIVSEINLFAQDTSTGNLIYQADLKGVKGDWAMILNGLNKAVSMVRDRIIENAPMTYIVVSNHYVLDCNRFAQEQLGVKIGEPMERYYKDILESKRIVEKLQNIYEIEREEVIFKDINGDFRRYELFINIIDPSNDLVYIIWGVDVEEERKNTDTIKESQKDLQKLIDTLPISMIIEDTYTKQIKYANAAFYRLMDLDKAEVLNINETELFYNIQADGQSIEEKEQGISFDTESNQTGIEITYKSGTGKCIDTRVTASEIIYSGQKSIVKVIHDIGEEKIRTQMLQAAAKHEREANQLKSRFLANMSHEIRTPMNAIIGLAQLALMREQEVQNVETFKKVLSSAKNLLTIINDILDFSKIESQKLDIVEDNFSLEDIISNAFMMASERIEEKHIEMLLEIEPELPLYLYGDKTRLWQILKNLLDNSAKYTEKGSIILKAFVKERKAGKIYVTFKITDTGIGMAKEELDSLFVPFTQFSDSYKYKSSGTGLGMSITKQIIDLMGGTIEVQSEPGKGTETFVTIGFKQAESDITLKGLGESRIQNNFSVLIADDDLSSCEIMKGILEIAGFHPICVQTGKDALAQVRLHEEQGDPFKIIILDYLLGEENGIDIGREISQSSSHTKLLMVSAYVKKIPENQIQEVGFVEVLQKPLIPSAFIECLYDSINSQSYPAALKRKKYSFPNAKILLCEDNLLNQEIAVEMLKVLEIEADVADNGKECLAMLEKKPYDLILMDILMPIMDGKEATRLIRASDKPYKDICIIALTANVIVEQVEEFMSAGMNGHIPKPIEFETLAEELSKNLPKEKQKVHGFTEIKDIMEAGFAIEGISVNEGLARFAGKEERYKKALLHFANENSEIRELELSQEFHQYIHTIKGVSANLGMTKLSEMARALEQEILSDIANNETYQKFYRELKYITRQISISIRNAGDVKMPKHIESLESLSDSFAQLTKALNDYNPSESENIIKHLQSVDLSGFDPLKSVNLDLISQAIDQYDFEKAMDLLGE